MPCGAGLRPARPVAVQSISEAVEWGTGSKSVMGEGSRESSLQSLSQGGETDGLGQGAGTGSQKDKIKLL